MKKSLKSLFIIFSLILTFGCKGGIAPSLPEEITTGTITGKAVYQNAAESSGITVTLEKTDGLKSLSVVRSIELGASDFSARSIAGNSTTDSEGSYSFTDIEEGIYTIYASSKDSTEKAVTTNVIVERNQTVTAEDLKLTATGNISGKITLDNSETNSAGFLVSVAGTSYIATTDVDGSFTISSVPAKEGYHIIVTKQMLTYMFTDSVTVTAKETVTIQPKNFTVSDLTAGYTSGNDGTSINWRGSFASGDEIKEPKYLDAYFNTTDGCSYIYDGLKWTLLVKTAEEHEWDSGIFIKEQTCTEDGYKIYTCVKCSLLKGESIPSLGGHTYNENFVCVNCGEVKELTVQEFLSTIGNSVTTITADTSKPGITKSRDGKTVNIYGVKISGEFSYSSKFPISLETADLSGLDTSKVTSMKYMFYNCSKLTSIRVNNFDTSNVTSMEHMFYNCSKLTSIRVSNFDTSNVTNMSYMFAYCNSLTSLDVNKFDTSKVTNISDMFSNCTSLTDLDLSSFDTSNVTNMNSMFYYCNSLTSLDVNKFNTSKVTNMSHMFSACKSLTSLNLSSFNTSKVTVMCSMFNYCNSLTSLDVSSFDTSKVTDMNNMFSICKSLTSLDLSSFDTSKVTDMSYMFSGCLNLESIFTSQLFVTDSLTNDSSMFGACNKLKGAISYNSSKTNATYANPTTGYFTLKQE